MSRFPFHSRPAAFALVGLVFVPAAVAQNPTAEERFAATPDAILNREAEAFDRVSLPIPKDIVLEVGGIVAVPGQRLLVATRHGDIWWVDGAYEANPQPRYSLFATGLHEVLGLIAAPQGGYYIAQRQEITHLQDTDGDDRADEFKTIYKIPVAGNYHEYAFGPKLGLDGHLRVALNVGFGGGNQSRVPWRGWMLDIAPDGTMTPIAAGLRSPAGYTQTSKGIWIAAENQGEWVGSGRVTVIEKGDFIGHPASLNWADLPGSPVKLRPEDITNFEEPFNQVAARMPGVKTPAVWFPHTILGISTSDIVEDQTGGGFGPFAGQFYVGDQGQSKIMRMSLEQVKGVWQGAAYFLRAGFDSGIVRLAWGEDSSLFVGSTARGWGAVGPKDFALERVRFTGQTPFELQEIKAAPDGFVVHFTQPVDPSTAADPAAYAVTSFNYLWHKAYGSPIVDRLSCPVVKVELAPDHRSARLAVACLREGYIHEVKAAGVRSAAGQSLVHDNAFYTLNRIPDGDTMMPPEELRARAELCAAAAAAPVAPVASATRVIDLPVDWPDEEVTTITLRAQSGLKFDLTELIVRPGARIALELINDDDMLHNIVITAPGQGQIIGAAALNLGLAGDAKSYVPDLPGVIAHSRILGPHERETIYFTAPAEVGDYDYVCTFPGHFALMKGVMKVR